MEFHEFPQGQREYPDLGMAAGDVRGQLRGQKIRIGTRYVDIAVFGGVQRRKGKFPRTDVLNLVEKNVIDAAGNDPLLKESIELTAVPDILILETFEIDECDTVLGDSRLPQFVRILFEKDGFSAAPHARDHFDHVCIVATGAYLSEIGFAYQISFHRKK